MKVESYENAFLQNKDSSMNKMILKLLPLLFIVCILPLVVHSHVYKSGLETYRWYYGSGDDVDFFLYFKQMTLTIIGAVMLLTLIIRRCITNEKISFHKIFIPIVIYIVMAMASSMKSEYASYAYGGIYERFESVFALMSYGVILYYAYTVINSERELKAIMGAFLTGMFLLLPFGISQIMSHDFFRQHWFQKLYLSDELFKNIENLTFKFEENRVHLTMFNSNYVGVYTALAIPILICMIYFSKKVVHTVIYIIATAGMIICLVGSKSKAGMLTVFIGCIFIAIFLRKQLIKKWYFTITGVLGGIAIVLLLMVPKSPLYSINLSQISARSEKPSLEDIHIEPEYVSITYKGNELRLSMWHNGMEFQGFQAVDKNNVAIDGMIYDSENTCFYTQDSRFPGFKFAQVNYDETHTGFVVVIDDVRWFFVCKDDSDMQYGYVNAAFEEDEIEKAETAIFTNYDKLASGRGFIWARTIPLLKKHMLLGAGANVFAFEFPHTDYVGYYNAGFRNSMVTKPHSWYLQMGVETGVVSMISIIVFYLIYLVSSIRIYSKNDFTQYSSCLGVAIFIGVTCYFIMGLTNDSCITVAPVFWVIMGCGLAINYKFHTVKKESQ